MKKLIIILATQCLLMVAGAFNANATTIKVTVSAKSYWNGTGCTARDQGGCVHIEIGINRASGTFNGTLNYDDQKGLTLVISRSKDISEEDFETFFKNGVFSVGGPLTFESKALDGI